ncbi:zinc finger transcriptional activator [Microsporum canis]
MNGRPATVTAVPSSVSNSSPVTHNPTQQQPQPQPQQQQPQQPQPQQPQQPQDLNTRFSPQRSISPPAQHRRGYQACDPCRKRKVKCDLGSVDNPRPPPCVRCRRESKRCEFSATRRKRKISEESDDKGSSVLRRDKRMMVADGSVSPSMDSDSISSPIPNGVTSHPRGSLPPFENDPRPNGSAAQRKWSNATAPPHRICIPPTGISVPAPTSIPLDQYHAHRASFSSAVRPTLPPHVLESGQHMMNKTAAELLSPAISNTHDALHLLSEAAGRTEDLNRQQMEYQYNGRHSSTSTFASVSPGQQNGTPGRGSRSNSTTHQGAGMSWYNQNRGGSPSVEVLVEGTDAGLSPPKASHDLDYSKARRAWSRLRFIRAGWFSVDEAMSYIEYYYEHLAPLTPIVLKNYSSPSTHLTLLTEEPVLTVTMLTIASRHMKLSGNGANSRAYSIHEKLWSYLRGMIERLFWGQEKFGDCGGASAPRQFDASNPLSAGHGQRGGGQLRSIGTVEALLLLTDWHPRALHFPPGDDENTLLDVDPQQLNYFDGEGDDHFHDHPGKGQGSPGEGRLAFYKWLEPVWRSDRMSWMLLSTAQALAFELGIFDQKNDLRASTETSCEIARKRRLRRLILVYVSQSSGRLGIPSMLPLPQWNQNTEPPRVEDMHSPNFHEDYMIDMMQDCWMDISKIMYNSNQVLFLSKELTTNLIKSGQYRDRIDEFTPSLRDFKAKLDKLSVSPQMRNVLTIEYEYTRLYVNCLALQAVVERWTTMNEAGSSANQNHANGTANGTSSGAGTVPLQVLLEQYEVNEPYIQEVVDASRRILQIVLEGFVPGDILKHAPVRTYFRILSGMIFILKTFTLGAKEDDVRVSLELQDRTIECLRTCVVDDVHLSVTIADLLQLLTSNIRNRFLRFAPFDRVGESGSRHQSPAPTSEQDSRDQQHHHSGEHSDYRWQQNHNNGTPSTSGFSFDNHHPTSAPPTTHHDPLANIPVQPINSSSINVSFMPPPPSVYYNYYDPSSTSPKMEMDESSSTVAPPAINTSAPSNNNTTQANSNSMSDWFALPLDQFFNSSTAGVDQGLGGTGPMVGEFDMLEVLLKEQYTGDNNTNGTSTNGPAPVAAVATNGSGMSSHFI